MDQDRFDDRVEYCLEQKIKGKTYSYLREEMKAEGISEENISAIIKETDRQFLSELIDTGVVHESRFYLIVGGLALIIIGVSISIATYYRAVKSPYGGEYLIVYGPVLTGISMIFYEQRKKRNRYINKKNRKWQRKH